MVARVTRDIIESYLNCKYKAHLKLTGQRGAKSEYEALLVQTKDEVRSRVIDKILSCHQEEEAKVEQGILLTHSFLKQGAFFILDATMEEDDLSLTFDGLKREPGPSSLGDFRYIPVLFSEGGKVSKERRLLLELWGLALSRLQGTSPGHGVIYHRQDTSGASR